MSQGIPKPKNTLTPLLPVTFPTEASAYFSFTAALRLAKRSGRLVPNATKVIAVTSFLSPIKHPNMVAMSPTIAVRIPIMPNITKNANQPPYHVTGGTMANNT